MVGMGVKLFGLLWLSLAGCDSGLETGMTVRFRESLLSYGFSQILAMDSTIVSLSVSFVPQQRLEVAFAGMTHIGGGAEPFGLEFVQGAILFHVCQELVDGLAEGLGVMVGFILADAQAIGLFGEALREHGEVATVFNEAGEHGVVGGHGVSAPGDEGGKGVHIGFESQEFGGG